jgi:hypothetical protein
LPALHEVQRQLLDSLIAGAGDAAPAWIATPAGEAVERLNVYRTTVSDTLVRALRLTFPTVHRLVGAEFFEDAGRVFAREHLPISADLHRYGAEFPAFLQDFDPCSGLRYLPDVAHLDWAAAGALHACEAESMRLDALAAVTGADAATLRFTAHPSISLLRSEFPVDAIWRAVLQQDDAAMAAIDLASGPVHLIVERVADAVHMSRMPPEEWQPSVALMQGRPLAEVVDATGEALDAPMWLAKHLAAGRLIAFVSTSSQEACHDVLV